ncbi:MAG: AraC family transcriptional regulator [Bacteroides sp.]|nr:AraC family transcriptional regulator [Bacteroidales bacterium]MBD5316363.1 AraC family transcriptional regulator [Bacteroides sp.]MBD5377683.1 AraC family transcriptional regulator [Bacteroides sp.]
MTTDTITNVSPARRLIHNGLGVFYSISQLSGFHTPFTIGMTMLVVCENGELSGTIDLVKRTMRPGSIMVLRRGHIIHDIHESDDFRGFFILAEDERLDSHLPMMSYMAPCLAYFRDNPIVPIPESELENLKMLHELLRRKYTGRSDMPYNQLTVNAVCEALFYEAVGIYTTVMNRRNYSPSRREELLSRFIELVDTDFRRERTVSYYAKKLCLSPKHLSTVIKNISGLTAGEWIDRKVVLEAKLMLRNSGLTIQEISTALNFSNQSFFGKYFKHLTGLSPREFRSNTDV